ncbi:MAG: hypothetical protein CME65_05010 [Halobacteriovoraceae bacterium]|nr:hypothetical protein [Halobacteriovoraceae bacterium]|tara:strand:+ start:3285 stop:4472 length:1188 start_codon:yes stop_codon:yes gene_type:complete
MKSLFKNLAIGLFAVGVFSQSAFANSQYETEFEDRLRINIASYCQANRSGRSCIYQGSFTVEITCSGSSIRTDANMIACDGYEDMTIKTSAPMLGIDNGAILTHRRGTTYAATSASQGYLGLPENTHEITIDGNSEDNPELISVDINTGIPTYIVDNLSAASNSLRFAYSGVLRNLNDFESQIARSHRGHLVRFKSVLTDGIDILSELDDDDQPVYGIVHWKVQENSRMIVAFGSILDELLTDYDDIERLQYSIRAMRTLVAQLKESYGWGRSLSGQVSRASSTLLEVVRLELQELGGIKMSIGADVSVYSQLLTISAQLKAKVDSSRSGDMRAQREIFDFLDAWNSSAWQAELDTLVNAGPDVRNLVTPKVVMLLQAMESLEDLTDAGFELPME